MRVEALETPALLIDLDAMESNLTRVSEFYRRGPSVSWTFAFTCSTGLSKTRSAIGTKGFEQSRL